MHMVRRIYGLVLTNENSLDMFRRAVFLYKPKLVILKTLKLVLLAVSRDTLYSERLAQGRRTSWPGVSIM